jgi:hypothetical protein
MISNFFECRSARLIRSAVCFLLCLGGFSLQAQQFIEADVCVYGGTSAGVVAAVQASRMGKSVVLLEFGKHLGGLSSGGLGQTDVGNKAAIGGISRDFYRRVGQHYGKSEQWTFEPHVAEDIFNQMIAEENIPVYFEQRLASVEKVGARIVKITMENGNVIRAKMFIDATYEGDLIAKAGVSYHVGREANSFFGETLNGIRAETWGNQFSVGVDPYVVPGNPASGLLPLVQPGNGGVPGEGDNRVQAYNFRMCLTQNPSNFIQIAPPPIYDPARFELLARYIEARVAHGDSLQLRQFFKLDMMPNGKTDSNNEGGFSTDYIGGNYDYPEADYARRAEIWQEHEDYIRGFFTFLGTSPRVPLSLRNEMQSWGLAKDEFVDGGGWPHQLYIREARRMMSDYVMTEHNCRGDIKAEDPISLAAYNMDSHNCQRIAKNGSASNEGDVQVGVAPYPISYRAIVPKQSECENLLVPVCLSASHIAYGSIRMEPVFMILGQSAATAACFAIDDNVPLQELSYAKLKLQLLADKQVLQWGAGGESEPGIVVDNTDVSGVEISGDWSASSSVVGFYGANYLHDGNASKGTKFVRFTPNLPTNGIYSVYLRWTTDPNRASNVPVDVIHADGMNTVFVNQKNQNGQWVLLGNFSFNSGTNGSVRVRTTGTDGYVVADAVRFGDSTPLTTVNVLATDAQAAEMNLNPAQFTFVREGATNSALKINYTLGGTAGNGVDYQTLSGSTTIPAGAISGTISLLPLADEFAEGGEAVALTLFPSTNYVVGNLSNATATIRDKPSQGWKKSEFTDAELLNASISGDDADPDQDGIPNFVEYALGTDPKIANALEKPVVSISENNLSIKYDRLKSARDVSYTVEISDDLSAWDSGPNFLNETVIADDSEIETRVATDKFPVDAGARKFLRLRIAPQ